MKQRAKVELKKTQVECELMEIEQQMKLLTACNNLRKDGVPESEIVAMLLLSSHKHSEDD